MKKLLQLMSFLVFVLFLSGCDGTGVDLPEPAEYATYRVEYFQKGDYKKFYRSISVRGGEFKFKPSGEFVPPVLFDSDLKEASYTFEASDVKELVIDGINTFSVVEDGPATLQMRFVIYRNNVKIDEKTYENDHLSKDQNIYMKYITE